MPAFRGFTINGSGTTSGGFYIKVLEDVSHSPAIHITPDDTLVVAEYALSIGAKVKALRAVIVDKTAPILHWDAKNVLAIVHRDAALPDTLFITFSEPVNYVSAPIPFHFLSRENNGVYTAIAIITAARS